MSQVSVIICAGKDYFTTLVVLNGKSCCLFSNGKRHRFFYNLFFGFFFFPNFFILSAIRFGRMPRSEKAKLKAEILTGENYLEDSEMADLKSLAKRIHDAYLKNFNMNKVKARVILAGKTNNNPVSNFNVTLK